MTHFFCFGLTSILYFYPDPAKPFLSYRLTHTLNLYIYSVLLNFSAITKSVYIWNNFLWHISIKYIAAWVYFQNEYFCKNVSWIFGIRVNCPSGQTLLRRTSVLSTINSNKMVVCLFPRHIFFSIFWKKSFATSFF